MNLALAAGTLGVIVPAELPDKTFISAIILASKYPPIPVWVGTAAGLVVQAAIGVVAGRLLALLPHRTVEAVVAGLFLAGAAYLLLVPERREETRGAAAATRWRRSRAERVGPEGDHSGDGSGTADGPGSSAGAATNVTGPAPAGEEPAGPVPAGPAPAPATGGRSPARIALMAFGIVALAELGDLTQVIVANLTARSRDPWSVFAGAAVGFLLISAAGVAAGRTIVRYVPLSLVRRLSGLALAGLGAWSLVAVLGG